VMLIVVFIDKPLFLRDYEAARMVQPCTYEHGYFCMFVPPVCVVE
jgi:hypothetical protein